MQETSQPVLGATAKTVQETTQQTQSWFGQRGGEPREQQQDAKPIEPVKGSSAVVKLMEDRMAHVGVHEMAWPMRPETNLSRDSSTQKFGLVRLESTAVAHRDDTFVTYTPRGDIAPPSAWSEALTHVDDVVSPTNALTDLNL